jgi:hypothetical protein
MDFKAQSSPEYLLVFVSIMVLLITAVSVFFVVLSPKLACYSSDPKIIVENYALPYSKNYALAVCPNGSCNIWGYLYTGDTSGKMTLKNLTGETIFVVGVEPDNKSYSSQQYPSCMFVQLFVPYYINGQSYNRINGGNSIQIASGNNIIINNLFLSQEALGLGCKADDFPYPAVYSFALTYEGKAARQQTVKITCEGFPEKN